MNDTKVIKRDGSIVSYNKDKFINAIYNAILASHNDEELRHFDGVSLKLINCIEQEIEKKISVDNTISVESIQDIVERQLIKNGYADTAICYIRYRHDHSLARNKYKEMVDVINDKLFAKNVQNQNANVDERSFGGRKGEMTNEILKKYALDYCMSEKHKLNHINNRIYIHDLDSYALGMHNCLSIPFDDLLKNGFNTRQVDIRPAGSINTAFQLVAVIFQLQSLQQFGGVSATHLDWTMVPYVRLSFWKHYRDLMNMDMDEETINGHYTNFNKISKEEMKNMSINDIDISLIDEDYHRNAMILTQKELEQAVEGLYHNLNSLQSRSGNQLPFSSINYGTCTSFEGRMVIKALLKGLKAGVGRFGKTSVFPCGIFQVGKGINLNEGDPNYDLFLEALDCTAKRLYPNYANIDWSGNAGYDKNDPRTYFSTMGALDGKEHLYVKFGDTEPIDISIKELFEIIKNHNDIIGRPSQVHFPVERSSLDEDANIVDTDTNVYYNNSGVYRITYLPEDVSYIGSTKDIKGRITKHKSKIRTTGGIDAGMSFNDHNLANYKFEVISYCEDYEAQERNYIMSEPNANLRGISNRYYKIIQRKFDPIYERPNFNQDYTIPQDLIDVSDLNIMVYDIGNKWTKIRHIFKNDKKNSPFMMHITYVELGKEYTLSCTEDHPLWNGETFVRADNIKIGDTIYRADGLKLTVTQISWHWEPVDSYDIGTETGTFIGSDIMMHNCRTANGYDINGFGQMKDGRGNIAPATIILPTLAMEAKEQAITNGTDIVETFMDILNTAITDTIEELTERFEYICSQPAESAKFMYENNIMAGYDGKNIKSALKHGTLAVGMLGMAETLQILIGTDQCTDEGMELAKRICQLYKDRCATAKEEKHLNFGLYFTPAETTVYTAMKKFKAKYGEIPNVSDKLYFTNSIHVPVWKKMTAFEKIDIESQLDCYSSAGCIFYIENDAAVTNVKALEKIVRYGMEKDIPYFAINSPNDLCNECGYCGTIENECPRCGSTKISRLRRVTGYLTGDYKTAFNLGKQNEVEDRVSHTSVEG